MHIRSAALADLEAIVDFNARLAAESEGKTLDLSLLRPGVLAVLSDPAKGRYFVATEGEPIIGQLAITYEWSDWRNGNFWWIQSVYVRSEARRRGVFRALFKHLVAEARCDDKVIGIRLYVEKENTAAQETYRRMGLMPTSYDVMERYPL